MHILYCNNDSWRGKWGSMCASMYVLKTPLCYAVICIKTILLSVLNALNCIKPSQVGMSGLDQFSLLHQHFLNR
jgi:hypothetical protein